MYLFDSLRWTKEPRKTRRAMILLRAIEAAHNKLAGYYGKTEGDTSTLVGCTTLHR